MRQILGCNPMWNYLFYELPKGYPTIKSTQLTQKNKNKIDVREIYKGSWIECNNTNVMGDGVCP